jgi:hypothetical protein
MQNRFHENSIILARAAHLCLFSTLKIIFVGLLCRCLSQNALWCVRWMWHFILVQQQVIERLPYKKIIRILPAGKGFNCETVGRRHPFFLLQMPWNCVHREIAKLKKLKKKNYDNYMSGNVKRRKKIEFYSFSALKKTAFGSRMSHLFFF